MGNTNRKVDGDTCNKTQLDISKALSRLIIHRDYLAHLFRFGHVLKQIKVNKPQIILDVGCGNRQLAMCIYSNKASKGVKEYHGVDLRDTMLEDLKKMDKFPIINHACDVTKENGQKLLDQLDLAMTPTSTLFFSTPCYSEKKGQASNHVYEWEFDELKEELDKRFTIEKVFGTFCDTGIGKNKQILEDFFGKEVWGILKDFFESSILSNMVAPLFPALSRNCMWVLRKK